MELREYLAITRKWLWLFVLATVVAAVSAWVATQFMPRTYSSQATLMVGRSVDDPTPDYMNVALTKSLAETYAQMATRQPVLEHAIKTLGLTASWQQLRGMVRAKAVPGSQLVEISVIDVDPLRAQVIADGVAKAVIEKSPTPKQQKDDKKAAFVASEQADLQSRIEAARKELQELDTKIGLETSARAIADLQTRKAGRESQISSWRSQFAAMDQSVVGSTVNSLEIIENAAPGFQVGPNVRMNILLAALIGFGLALAAALALEYMDDTVKSAEIVERRLGVANLATIEVVADARNRRDTLVAVSAPRSPVAEAFRTMRTNLQFSLVAGDRQALLITSPSPGEGKSTVAANVAVVMAQNGLKVILVDADLRRPTMHRTFGLPNSLGMTSLLLDPGLTVADAIRPIDGAEGLSVLTSGPLPPNPAELLGSAAMTRLLANLRQHADIVVFDSPPLLAVTDAAVLAVKLDGSVLVFHAGTTRMDAARRAISALEKVGVTPIGSVVNRLDRREGRYYSAAYRYKYDYSSYYGTGGDDEGTGGESSDPPRTGQPTRQRGAVGWAARVRETMASFLS
jgi:non-specific protein-tyrosine kinase